MNNTHHTNAIQTFFFPTSLIECKIQAVDRTTPITTATGIVMKPRINVNLQNIENVDNTKIQF